MVLFTALKLAEMSSITSEVAMKVGEKAVEFIKNGEGLQKFMKNGMSEMNSLMDKVQEILSPDQFSDFSENTNKLDSLQNKIEQSPEEVSNNREVFSSEYNDVKTNLTELINTVDTQSLPIEQKNIFSDTIKQINEIEKVLSLLPTSVANEMDTVEDNEDTNNSESE